MRRQQRRGVPDELTDEGEAAIASLQSEFQDATENEYSSSNERDSDDEELTNTLQEVREADADGSSDRSSLCSAKGIDDNEGAHSDKSTANEPAACSNEIYPKRNRLSGSEADTTGYKP